MLSFFASRSTWSLWSRVLPGFTGFYRVFLGFTGFYRVFVDLIASRQRRRTRCCEAACHTTRCNAALVTSVYWSAETKERERERRAGNCRRRCRRRRRRRGGPSARPSEFAFVSNSELDGRRRPLILSFTGCHQPSKTLPKSGGPIIRSGGKWFINRRENYRRSKANLSSESKKARWRTSLAF